MTSDAGTKIVSRFMTVMLVVAVFAGCAALLAGGQKSLFADAPAMQATVASAE